MASWDNNLGMWKASTGGYYNSKADAVAAEASGAAPADASAVDLTDFHRNQGQASILGAVDNTRTPEQIAAESANRASAASVNPLSPAADQTATYNSRVNRAASQASTPEQQQAAYAAGNVAGASGAYNVNGAATRGGYDQMRLGQSWDWMPGGQILRSAPAGVSRLANATPAGKVLNAPPESSAFLGTAPGQFLADAARAKGIDYGAADGSAGATGGAGAGAAGAAGGAGAPANDTARADAASEATERAGNAYDAQVDKTTARDDSAWSKAWSAIDSLQPTDTSLSDEARGYQKEGLQQQRMLLQRMLGFDPNQYATQFGDQALARTIAAGRSAGGGYAGQQQGILAAMDQAPSLYAEGARQASQLENQRLSGAETAAKNFGDLGTLTRGQDAQQAQFESSLGLSIANSVGDLTKGQVQLDQQQTQAFAQIWTDFAKLQSVYAGMDETEQLHYLDQQFQDKQLSQQWSEFKQTLAAQGDIKPKDIIAGFFQLGGGAISALGTIGAASAKSGS